MAVKRVPSLCVDEVERAGRRVSIAEQYVANMNRYRRSLVQLD